MALNLIKDAKKHTRKHTHRERLDRNVAFTAAADACEEAILVAKAIDTLVTWLNLPYVSDALPLQQRQRMALYVRLFIGAAVPAMDLNKTTVRALRALNVPIPDDYDGDDK